MEDMARANPNYHEHIYPITDRVLLSTVPIQDCMLTVWDFYRDKDSRNPVLRKAISKFCICVSKAVPDKTFYTGSYFARLIKGPTKTVRLPQSQKTALKKPAVSSPNVETGQRKY
jgi:hypothetical protein